MKLKDLPSRTKFSELREIEVIKVLMWWAHEHASREWVNFDFLRECYSELHRAVPTGGFSSYFASLLNRKPPQVIKRREGYKLEHRTLEEIGLAFGQRESTVQIEKMLLDLPGKLANTNERSYLEEALTCFRNSAFRASVVMTWNLAYDHVCYWVLADSSRLAKFNAQMAKTYAKKKYSPIVDRESFEEPKEFEVIQVLKSSGLIGGGMHMILKEKLDRRNKAAHPTGTTILQPTAEDVIADLIENVVLKLQ